MSPIEQLKKHVSDIAHNDIMPRFLNTQTQQKQDGSMLTEADLVAQAQLAARLPEIIDAPVLGEEMLAATQRELWRTHAKTGLWVVDPIDGTRNFANGLPHFAVSVAFVRDYLPQMGVIYQPILREMFWAEQGGGAFLNGQTLPLRVSPKRLADAVAGVEVKWLGYANLSSRIHTLSPVRSMRSMGSSTLDWCYLAAGRYDVYVHGGQNLWDYAAGALILTEAGGHLGTLEGDDFWSQQHTFKRSVIAATEPNLFAAWQQWVRQNL